MLQFNIATWHVLRWKFIRGTLARPIVCSFIGNLSERKSSVGETRHRKTSFLATFPLFLLTQISSSASRLMGKVSIRLFTIKKEHLQGMNFAIQRESHITRKRGKRALPEKLFFGPAKNLGR